MRIWRRSSGRRKAVSVGGMISKIQAAKKASRFEELRRWSPGKPEGVLHQILKGKEIGTLILPPKGEALSSRETLDCLQPETKGQRHRGRGSEEGYRPERKESAPIGCGQNPGGISIEGIWSPVWDRVEKSSPGGWSTTGLRNLKKSKAFEVTRLNRPWVTSIGMK